MGEYDVFANVIVLAPKKIADSIYAVTTPFIDRTRHLACGITHLPNDAGLLFKVLGMETGPVKQTVREFLGVFRKQAKGRDLSDEFPWR